MIAGYQRQLRALCLASEATDTALRALGGEEGRWQAYRRLVRSRLHSVIGQAFERFSAAIGAARFEALVDSFLAERGSRSPYLRDVAGEFLFFLEESLPDAPQGQELPNFALDLARYEWAELETACTEEATPQDLVELDMSLRAVLSPARRLLRLDYAVHRLEPGAAGPEMVREAVWLCLYREKGTHIVRTLELAPITGALLEEIDQEARSLTEIVQGVTERLGVRLDVAWVDALSAVLADLLERGVILGSRRAAVEERAP